MKGLLVTLTDILNKGSMAIVGSEPYYPPLGADESYAGDSRPFVCVLILYGEDTGEVQEVNIKFIDVCTSLDADQLTTGGFFRSQMGLKT